MNLEPTRFRAFLDNKSMVGKRRNYWLPVFPLFSTMFPKAFQSGDCTAKYKLSVKRRYFKQVKITHKSKD